MITDKKHVSKLISYWLRHHPEAAGLVLDEFGWSDISCLLNELKAKGYELTVNDIVILNQSFDKVRWAFNEMGNKIRATHGHSVNIVIEENPITPPDILYHGTAIKFLEHIIMGGLKAMSRQFVHLSSNPAVALQVGDRHGKSILIKIDAQALHNDGHIFYNTSDNVWLTKVVPDVYLQFGQWHRLNYDKMHFLQKELNNEVGLRHTLYSRLQTLEPLMRRYDRDDCLFIDKKDNSVHIVHLTWNNENYYSDIYPNTVSYVNLAKWLSTDFLEDYEFE